MKKVLAAAGIASLALLAISAPANAGPDDKISICHATGSDSNPYVEITISENGLNGHNAQGVHDGDIVPAPAGGCPGGDNGDQDGDQGGDNESDSKKVTICHATGSEKNPYVVITIAEKAWLNGHKDGHGGNPDLYPVPAKGCHVADDGEEKPEEENPGGGGGDTTVPPAVVSPLASMPFTSRSAGPVPSPAPLSTPVGGDLSGATAATRARAAAPAARLRALAPQRSRRGLEYHRAVDRSPGR